jgi:hypothetical protein
MSKALALFPDNSSTVIHAWKLRIGGIVPGRSLFRQGSSSVLCSGFLMSKESSAHWVDAFGRKAVG